LAVPASSVKAIIFDCFGVFYVDPFAHFIAAAKPEVQRELRDLMLAEDLGHVDATEIVARYSELTGLPKSDVEQQLYGVRLVRNEALLDYAESLRTTYKLGLLSNVSPGAMDKYFTQAERAKYFDAVVVSAEVGLIKPQPEIYKLMAERLGVAPNEAIFIDDLPANCEGARATGMQALVYAGMRDLQPDLETLLQ